MGPVFGIDVGNQFLDKNVLTQPVFLLRVIVPTHGAPVREDVDRWLNLPIRHGLIDKSGQRDTLLFQSRTSAMEVVDDREFELPLRSVDRARVFPRLEIGQGKK